MNVYAERMKLGDIKADAYGYGAKDTGEMGGGAAGYILSACGPEIFDETRRQLATSTRLIGDAVLTDAFDLKSAGVKKIIHIISIIKNTPQGAWCPYPDKLEQGVYKGLGLAYAAGCRKMALSALGTNEGRVKPRDAAKYMMGGIKKFLAEKKDGEVVLALPTKADYDEFVKVL